jgi:HK97 family phage major capsid protein
MKTLRELLERRAAALDEAKAIEDKAKAEDRLQTDEEGAQFDALLDEVKSLDEEIERHQTAEGKRKILAELGQNRPVLPVKPDSPSPTPRLTVPAEPKKLKWNSFGEFLVAVKNAAIAPHRIDPRLDPGLDVEAATGSSEGSPSGGGFLVGTDHSQEILNRVYSIGELASRVRHIPIGPNANGLTINAISETSRATGSRWGGVRAYWLAEAGVKTGSKPELRQVEWKLKKLAALWYATDELLQDSTAMESIAMQAFAEEINFMVEDSIINGTGAGQPTGILNCPALVSQAKETGQTAGTLVANNIIKMWSRMWARSRQNAVWLINQEIEPQLYTMSLPVGTGGVSVFLPPGGLSTSPYATLFGRPILPLEYCAALGTVGDIMLIDPSQYIMIDKGGIQSASSIHVQFIYDETCYRWVLRTDGKTPWNNVLTPYKGGANATQSPFVAVATR